MVAADDFDAVTADVFSWHAYDPSVKAELFSTAFNADAGMYVVDPISLRDHALDELSRADKLAGVIVTNANHERASRDFAARFGVTIWSNRVSFADSPPERFGELADGAKIDNDIEVIAIDGAAPGEIALCVRETLIVGDALINFEPYGFTFLPAKYWQDPKQMRRSLGRLLDLKFERILFAHGQPITAHARERLARLLAEAK